jgi:Zonular occludens toxin (Zot)
MGSATIVDIQKFGLVTPILWFCGILFLFFLMWVWDQLYADIATMPFGIIGFFGNQGRGKTFTMVTYARRWRKKHPTAAVYTNMYKLLVPGTGPVYTGCDLDQMMQAEDSLVLIDEAGVFINAWEWISGAQRQFALWAAATRHNGNLILVTAHAPEQLNIRVQKVLAELHFLESFQGLKLFRSYVYESFAGMKKANKTKTIWIPKWPTTCKSYDTQMLRKHLNDLGAKANATETELEDFAAEFDANGNPLTPEQVSNMQANKQTTTKKSIGKATAKRGSKVEIGDNVSIAISGAGQSELKHEHSAECAEWRVRERHAERDRIARAERNRGLRLREQLVAKKSG